MNRVSLMTELLAPICFTWSSASGIICSPLTSKVKVTIDSLSVLESFDSIWLGVKLFRPVSSRVALRMAAS